MHDLELIASKLEQKKDLQEQEAEEAVLLLAQETREDLIARVLVALAEKGETYAEVLGAARAVLKMARPFPRVAKGADIVGTGGDGKHTLNVSTLSALTLASAGVPVVKHGNRAASSRCGSADLLEALGFVLELPEQQAIRQLQDHSFTFLFAPYYHPGFKNVAALRKKLGIRTIFNLLGPLTNPALPSTRLIGVFNPGWMETLAKVLPYVGCDRAWVVHGGGGSDELDLQGENQVIFLEKGVLRNFTISAEEAGLPQSDLQAIQGGDTNENLTQSIRTLQGEPGPLHAAVAFNAGTALYLCGQAQHVREGVGIAREILKKGQPWELVEKLQQKS